MRFNELSKEKQDEILATTKSVCRHTAQRWPKSVTADDIEQMVLEALMGNEYAAAVRAAAEGDKDRRWMVLRKLANQIAAQERRDYEQFSGNFYYSVDEVRELLEDGILTDTNDPDRNVEEGIDLLEALTNLQARESPYVDVILERYTAEEPDVPGYKVSRALTALTDLMNDSHKARRIAYLERTEYGALA